MPRRRKNRTHLKGIRSQDSSSVNVPKSFVIKHGDVGSSLTQLTRDIRKVMEPNTATRLKVCLAACSSDLCNANTDVTFRASEGTFPKQTQRLLDHGVRASRHPPPRVHVDQYRPFFAYLAPVQRPHAQLSYRAL